MDHCTWSHGDLACGRRDAAAFEAIDQGDDLSWRFNPPGPTGMSGLWCLGKPQPMDQAPRKCYQIIQIYPSPRLSSSSPPHPWDCGSAEDTTAAGQLARTSHSTSLCWWVEVWTLEKWWKCESIGKILPARTENPTWFERPQPISWKHVQMHVLKQQKPRSAWRDLGARTMSSNLAAWKLMETIGFDHPWMVSWWLWGCHGTTNNLNTMAWSICVHLMPMLMGKLMISYDIYWYFGTPFLWRSPGWPSGWWLQAIPRED